MRQKISNNSKMIKTTPTKQDNQCQKDQKTFSIFDVRLPISDEMYRPVDVVMLAFNK